MSGKNLRDICIATCKLVAVLLIVRDSTKRFDWQCTSNMNSIRKEPEKNTAEMKCVKIILELKAKRKPYLLVGFRKDIHMKAVRNSLTRSIWQLANR